MLTEEQLQNLRERAEAASPGPWLSSDDDNCYYSNYGVYRKAVYADITLEYQQEVVPYGAYYDQGEEITIQYGIPKKEDAQYIAAASPDVILALLDELKTQKGLCRLLLSAFQA